MEEKNRQVKYSSPNLVLGIVLNEDPAVLLSATGTSSNSGNN